jgi:hypothetical protein
MHFCPHTDCDHRGWLGLNNPHKDFCRGLYTCMSCDQVVPAVRRIVHEWAIIQFVPTSVLTVDVDIYQS